jgi:hypothetical protein
MQSRFAAYPTQPQRQLQPLRGAFTPRRVFCKASATEITGARGHWWNADSDAWAQPFETHVTSARHIRSTQHHTYRSEIEHADVADFTTQLRDAAMALHTREQLGKGPAHGKRAQHGASEAQDNGSSTQTAKPTRVRQCSPSICLVAVCALFAGPPPLDLDCQKQIRAMQPEPTLSGYLRFLQESKLVFDCYETIIGESEDPQRACPCVFAQNVANPPHTPPPHSAPRCHAAAYL